MSDLPKYQRIPDEEQAYGHTKLDLGVEGEGGAADGLDAAGVGPGYPPVASGTWRDPGQKKRIELCLVPRWPLRCKEEMALGTMGATRDETVDLVREAFAPLREYPPERVEFLLKLSSGHWQRVMPSIWDTVVNDPPDQLGVRIADGPGDEEERDRRDRREIRMVIGGMLLGLCTFSIILFLSIQHDRRNKKASTSSEAAS